jgi:hypothetical protein
MRYAINLLRINAVFFVVFGAEVFFVALLAVALKR